YPTALLQGVAPTDDYVDSGGQGNDTIHSGDGPDYVNGQLGEDKLYADAGLDLILGGLGDDSIYVGQDNNTVDGGYGFDSIVSSRDVPVIQLRPGIVGTVDLPANGQLSGNAVFNLSLNGGAPVAVTLTMAATASNTVPANLIGELQSVIDA